MTTIQNMTTVRLLAMLPHASGVLRERIEAVLKARFSGTQIVPMPCIRITTGDNSCAQ